MKVISLFSGCGGLDLGFEKAGFEICERFSDISCAPVTDESERIFYVCRKK